MATSTVLALRSPRSLCLVTGLVMTIVACSSEVFGGNAGRSGSSGEGTTSSSGRSSIEQAKEGSGNTQNPESGDQVVVGVGAGDALGQSGSGGGTATNEASDSVGPNGGLTSETVDNDSLDKKGDDKTLPGVSDGSQMSGESSGFSLTDPAGQFSSAVMSKALNACGRVNTDIDITGPFFAGTPRDLTDGDDSFTGGSGADQIRGLLGRDVIRGGEGNDLINGNGDSDDINGNQGSDKIWGGAGGDLLRGGSEDDEIVGGDGDDTIDGDLGNDRIKGNLGSDHIRGLDGDDVINGNEGSDFVNGNQGSDLVQGGSEPDSVHGGAGDDCVIGGAGGDTVYGGGGFDFVQGGDGDDRLKAGGPDCRNPSSFSADFRPDIVQGWCQDQLASGFESEEICDGTDFSRCAQDILQGDAGSDRYIVRDGVGRVVIETDAEGANVLECQTSSPVQSQDVGADRFLLGKGFLIHLKGVNDGSSNVSTSACPSR